MVLNIAYTNGTPPEQIQGVRCHTIYFRSEDGIPEIVIHFKEYDRPSKYIDIRIVDNIFSFED